MAEEMELAQEESQTLQELKQVNSRRTKGPAAQAAEAAEVEEPLQPGESEVADPAELTDPETPPVEAKVRIGDREFGSQEEAFAYAKELYEKGETEKMIADAYRQGIQDAIRRDGMPQEVTQAQPEPEEDFDAKFFENPKRFLEDYAKRIREEAEQNALHKITVQETEKQLWNEFYSKNPDLHGFQRDCELVLEDEKEMIATISKTQGKDKAMDYLARKTRAKFQAYMERMRPQKELGRESARPTPSGAARVTQAEPESEAVDFVAQMRKHKRELESRS